MASSPITSWQIDGETVADFIFLGSKITSDGDYRHEIKRHLLLGRKAMTNLNSILQSWDITLLTKVHIVKDLFPVIMYGCESWTIKKDKHQRIDAFELWCLRRLFRVPWTARRSNQWLLREIKPECLSEGLMMKLKLQYIWPPATKDWLSGKTLVLGKIDGKRRRGQQRVRWLDDITDSMHMSLSKLLQMVKDREAWRAVVHGWQRVRYDLVTEQQISPHPVVSLKLTMMGSQQIIQTISPWEPDYQQKAAHAPFQSIYSNLKEQLF